MKTNATKKQLNEALNYVNLKFDNNVIFKSFEQKSKNRIMFTLRVKNSSGPGAKISKFMGKERKTISACWHVHGYFFEFLFKHYSDIIIYSLDQKMTNNNDNWKDKNVGNFYFPVNFSDCCNC